VKVVQINTADRKGGAGLAAYRLHCGFRRISEIEASLLVGIKTTADDDVVPYFRTWPGYIMSRACHRLLSRLGLTGAMEAPGAFSADRLLNSADLIHLHHIHGGFFSYPRLLKRAWTTPMVWTLHDMWSFTGFCSYSYDCLGWQTGCGSCPQLVDKGSPPDYTAHNWRWKRQACQEGNLTIVAPSQWLANLAKESPIHGRLKVHCIPNGVETDIFRPMDRALLRRERQIPGGAPVVLAQDEKRKGAGHLRRILEALPESLRERLFLVLVGSEVPEDLQELLGGGRLLATGYISEAEKMAECYALADLFLLPTEADNLPNTLLESTACGTPAVASGVGGCAEVIQHMETGYVAKAGDDVDFAKGIDHLFNNVELLQTMRDNCRRVAIEKFDVSVAVGRYLELYKSILCNK
jgi:glycosyltransferase involved in cell wall biosynthesis